MVLCVLCLCECVCKFMVYLETMNFAPTLTCTRIHSLSTHFLQEAKFYLEESEYDMEAAMNEFQQDQKWEQENAGNAHGSQVVGERARPLVRQSLDANGHKKHHKKHEQDVCCVKP